jgi:hypothetical protein
MDRNHSSLPPSSGVLPSSVSSRETTSKSSYFAGRVVTIEDPLQTTAYWTAW